VDDTTGQHGVTRLGTPAAFLMLAGLLLVYYGLRGFDAKYGTFGGTFAGSANGWVPLDDPKIIHPSLRNELTSA